LNVTILGNINPYTNPEYTTSDIKALDQTDLLALLTGIFGKDYTISAISSSVEASYVYLPDTTKNYTATPTVNSLKFSGLEVTDNGVICWVLYSGDAMNVSVNDVNSGLDGTATAFDCQSVYADPSSDESNDVTIDNLQDDTDYNFAYQLRGLDARPYAETSDVVSTTVKTSPVSTTGTTTEEESQYIMIFGLLSFIILLIINAWAIDS